MAIAGHGTRLAEAPARALTAPDLTTVYMVHPRKKLDVGHWPNPLVTKWHWAACQRVQCTVAARDTCSKPAGQRQSGFESSPGPGNGQNDNDRIGGVLGCLGAWVLSEAPSVYAVIWPCHAPVVVLLECSSCLQLAFQIDAGDLPSNQTTVQPGSGPLAPLPHAVQSLPKHALLPPIIHSSSPGRSRLKFLAIRKHLEYDVIVSAQCASVSHSDRPAAGQSYDRRRVGSGSVELKSASWLSAVADRRWTADNVFTNTTVIKCSGQRLWVRPTYILLFALLRRVGLGGGGGCMRRGSIHERLKLAFSLPAGMCGAVWELGGGGRQRVGEGCQWAAAHCASLGRARSPARRCAASTLAAGTEGAEGTEGRGRPSRRPAPSQPAALPSPAQPSPAQPGPAHLAHLARPPTAQPSPSLLARPQQPAASGAPPKRTLLPSPPPPTLCSIE
ncbi:hypothetical protein BDZ91DRAFT_786956 [Kalaharituber pfeilii]|nr:hypothetical protein BDZ91DRAFT_786956 [Kalaharituber pfeilii]